MSLEDLVSTDTILASVKAKSKRQLLQAMSELASRQFNIPERFVFDVIQSREKLGSTGVGNGIAIPHGKFEQLTEIKGLFARLEEPIEFDAIDGQPVDLVFVLLAPEKSGADHLKALSRIARVLRDNEVVSQIRETSDPDMIYEMLTRSRTQQAA